MYNYWHQCQLHYYSNTPDPPRHRNLPHLIDSLVILQGLCNQCVDCSVLGESRFFSTYRCLSCLRGLFPGAAAIFLLFAFVSCWHTRSISSSTASVPFDSLYHAFPVFVPYYGPHGSVSLSLAFVSWDKPASASRARLDWHQIGFPVSRRTS